MLGWPLTYCVVKGERELLILLQGPPFFLYIFIIFSVCMCMHARMHVFMLWHMRVAVRGQLMGIDSPCGV